MFDELLHQADPKQLFEKDVLLVELKKALVESMLIAEIEEAVGEVFEDSRPEYR